MTIKRLQLSEWYKHLEICSVQKSSITGLVLVLSGFTMHSKCMSHFCLYKVAWFFFLYVINVMVFAPFEGGRTVLLFIVDSIPDQVWRCSSSKYVCDFCVVMDELALFNPINDYNLKSCCIVASREILTSSIW